MNGFYSFAMAGWSDVNLKSYYIHDYGLLFSNKNENKNIFLLLS